MPIMRQIAGTLRIDLSQYRELAAFAQFGADLDRSTRARLARGERIYEVLKQEQYKPMPVVEQAIALYVAINGYLDSIPVEEVVRFEREFLAEMRMEYAELLERLNEDKELFPETEEELKKAIVAFKEKFVS